MKLSTITNFFSPAACALLLASFGIGFLGGVMIVIWVIHVTWSGGPA